MKSALRGTFFSLLGFLGVYAFARFLNRQRLTILLYHGVAPNAPREAGDIYNYRKKFITPSVFVRQMEYIATRYTVLDLEDALARSVAGTLPDYSLAITFDDGYQNVYEHAFPILKHYELPMTFFVTTDFVLGGKPIWVDRLEYAIGKRSKDTRANIVYDLATRHRLKTLPNNDRERELEALENETGSSFPDFSDDRSVYAPVTKEELAEMERFGVCIAAHTLSHPILSKLPVEEQHGEIAGSKDALSRIGVRVSTVFAYPNGQPKDFTPETEELVQRAGFTHALTTFEDAVKPGDHPYRLPRISIDGDGGFARFAAAVSGARSALRRIVR